MRDHIEKTCDEIDAALFSGDAFLDVEHRSKLREFMSRWERELLNIEKIYFDKK